jgi:hypothetical protein
MLLLAEFAADLDNMRFAALAGCCSLPVMVVRRRGTAYAGAVLLGLIALLAGARGLFIASTVTKLSPLRV